MQRIYAKLFIVANIELLKNIPVTCNLISLADTLKREKIVMQGEE